MFDATSKVLEDSARGGFYLSFGRVISGIVSAASLIIIARVLGSEQYGLYSISSVFPSILFIFVNPGINEGIMKFSASLRVKGEENRLARLLIHSVSFEAIIAFTAFTACFLFSDQFATSILNRPDIGRFIKIASALIIFQTIFTTINSTFIGLDKTEYNTITTVVQSIAKAIAAPTLVILGFSVAGALIGYVLSFALASILSILLFIFKIYRPLNRSNGDPESFSDNLRMLIAYGFPLYISVLMGGFAVQYQRILLSVFVSSYEIGNFQAAMNFNTIVTSISIPVAIVLLPAFSKIENRKETVRRFFMTSVKYTSMIILPIAVLLMVYAGEIVRIIYGEGWELAPRLLSLYAVTYFLIGLGLNILGSFYNGLGETKTSMKIAMASFVTLIILAPLLTWLLRVNGIIIALILSSLVGAIYGLHTARKSFGIRIDPKTVLRIYLVSLVSALPLFAIRMIPLRSNIIKVMMGAAAYFATYLLLVPAAKVVTSKELKEVKAVLEKVKPLRYLVLPILHFEEKIMLRIS